MSCNNNLSVGASINDISIASWSSEEHGVEHLGQGFVSFLIVSAVAIFSGLHS